MANALMPEVRRRLEAGGSSDLRSLSGWKRMEGEGTEAVESRGKEDSACCLLFHVDPQKVDHD